MKLVQLPSGKIINLENALFFTPRGDVENNTITITFVERALDVFDDDAKYLLDYLHFLIQSS
jgi:hypothetical protein